MRSRLIGGIVALVLLLPLASPARAIGPIVSIEISPIASSLSAGASTTFTVTGKDATNATTDLTTNSTFSMNDPKGSMAVNTYTAGQAGAWTVTAKYSTLTSSATVTVTPGAVTEIVVNPNSEPERLTNGQSRNFTAELYDARNNKIENGTIVWTVEGSIGTVTSTGISSAKFTATNNGSGKIVASSGNQKGSVNIDVSKSIITTNTNTSNANVNTSGNKNVSNVNTNGGNSSNTNVSNVNTSTNPTNASDTKDCKAWPRTTWVWVYLAYIILLAGSLWMLRTAKPTWWWVPPFLLTVAALWVYFQFRCYPVYPGLPYIILLTSVIGASWYTWQRGNPNNRIS